MTSGPLIDTENTTDTGNARRFARDWENQARYVAQWGKWVLWDGSRWRPDHIGTVHQLVADTVDRIAAAALLEADDDRRNTLMKWARTSESYSKIKAMVELAKVQPGIATSHERFDADPYLLACRNGTIDLHTGELRPADPSDMITKLAPVDYDPDAEAPMFMAFLEKIMPDEELRAFLARMVGYGITGSVAEQCLLFAYGTGANGKSTLFNLLLGVLGDYARSADPNLLLKSKHEAHPTNVADLQGSRFIATIEVEQGRQFAEVLIKMLTGGDRVKARFMRQDFFEFDPTFKIFLAANYRPSIRGVDHAIWRRIHLLPFEITVPPEERDGDLPAKLMAEAAGVLAWAVKGCLEWQRLGGLHVPARVTAATEAYRDEQDLLRDFLEDCCDVGPEWRDSQANLFEAYSDWASDMGFTHTWTQRRLSQELEARGFEKVKEKAGTLRDQRVHLGLRVRKSDNGNTGPTSDQASTQSSEESENKTNGTVWDRSTPPYAHTYAHAHGGEPEKKSPTVPDVGFSKLLVSSSAELDDLLAMLAAIDAGDVLAVDTETSGTSIFAGGWCTSIQVATGNRAWFVPVCCAEGEIENRSPKEATELVEAIHATGRRGAEIVAHNIGFDAAVLSTFMPTGEFLTDEIPIWDTYEVSWLLDENIDHGLKEIVFSKWGEEAIQATKAMEAKYGASHGRWPWATITAEDLFEYGVDDPIHCLRLRADQLVEITQEPTPVAAAVDLRHRFARVLYRLYRRGIRVDAGRVREGRLAAERRIAELRADPELQVTVPGKRKKDGPETRCVNVNSPKELPELLFETWGLEPLKQTRTGKDATDKAVLEKLAFQDARVKKILALRHDLKALSAYYGHLETLRDSGDRIHLQLTTSATTGRLASKGLNILTIPTERTNKEIRSCFIPAPGKVFYEIDLSQAELRIAAGVSKDKVMLAALENGDLYRDMAELCFGSRDDVSRQRAKPAMLGPPYGLGVERLAQHLVSGTPEPVTAATRARAERIKAGYAEKWPGVMNTYRRLAEMAKARGAGGKSYIKNPYFDGRYYRFTGESGKSPYYAAFNHCVQGTVLEIMLRVMVAVEAADLPGDLVLQVHDSLLFEAEPGGEEAILTYVQRVTDAINPFPSIPLRWEGKSWLKEA